MLVMFPLSRLAINNSDLLARVQQDVGTHFHDSFSATEAVVVTWSVRNETNEVSSFIYSLQIPILVTVSFADKHIPSCAIDRRQSFVCILSVRQSELDQQQWLCR